MARNLISFLVWLLCDPASPLVVPTHAHSAVGLQRVAATLCESEPLSRGEATGEYDGDGMTYSSADAVRDMASRAGAGETCTRVLTIRSQGGSGARVFRTLDVQHTHLT